MNQRSALVAKTASSELDFDVIYSEEFKSYYPMRRSRAFRMSDSEQEAPIVIWTEFHRRKATIFRTRGDRDMVQKCLIRIEGSGLDKPRELSATDFRAVQVSWVTEKLVFILLDIGHIAAVEAIYDVEKDSWLYRESVLYPLRVPSEN